MSARRKALIVFLLAGLALGGCGPAGEPQPEPTKVIAAPATGEPETPAIEPPQATQAPGPATSWKADGVISEGEYSHHQRFQAVDLWWRNDDQFLYLAMEGETAGWLGVGLDPEERMKGANFIIGAVEEGKVTVWDAYGTAPTSSHPADQELGGTADVVAYGGAESDGLTRLEVQIPLDSGDQYDKPLRSGESYPIIVAMGGSDSLGSIHTMRTRGQITLD